MVCLAAVVVFWDGGNLDVWVGRLRLEMLREVVKSVDGDGDYDSADVAARGTNWSPLKVFIMSSAMYQ